MQVRRASLILLVFGIITLLVIGAINLASQDKDQEEGVEAPPSTEQVSNEPSAVDNLQVNNQPAEEPSSSAGTATENLPRTGAEDFLAPIALSGVVLITSAYIRSRQTVRRTLLG